MNTEQKKDPPPGQRPDAYVAGLTGEQTYDAAFAAMVTKLPRSCIPLINEVFGEEFSADAHVEIRNGKHIVRGLSGSLARRETDSYIGISDTRDGETVSKNYHLECETWYDRSVIIRVAEYGSAIAMDNAILGPDGLVLTHPSSAVIFLRSSGRIPKKLRITHRFPNGAEASYDVPAVQIGEYSLREMIEKRLLILFPFFLFRYADGLDEIEGDPGRREALLEDMRGIGRETERMAREGEITAYQKRATIELLLRVSEKLTMNFENIRKGVTEVMSGYILRTEADDILEQGIEQGIEQGSQKAADLINFLWSQGRGDEAQRASKDRGLLNRLLEEFKSGSMPAQ